MARALLPAPLREGSHRAGRGYSLSTLWFTRALAPTLAVGSLGLAALGAGVASADPIGPNCGTCQGSIYTLTYDPTPVASTATTETFHITFTIDSSGYTGGGTGIDTVAIKISDALLAGDLIAAPLGVANWTNFLNRGLNAAGCSSGGSGYDCVSVALQPGFGVNVPDVGGTLTWEWNLKVATGELFTDPFQSSVKARYVDDDDHKVGALVSEGITLQPEGTPVPEPASAALAGMGLVLLAARVRRSRRG